MPAADESALHLGWIPLAATIIAASLCAFALQWLVARLALRPLRKLQDAHWTEKARCFAAGQVALLLGPLLIGLPWSGVFLSADNMFSAAAMRFLVPSLFLATFLGGGLAAARAESQTLQRSITLGDWLRHWAQLIILFLLPLFILVETFAVQPEHLSPQVAYTLGASLLAILLLDFGGAVLLARLLRLAQPASPRLLAIVDQAVQRVGLRPRASFILRWKIANAVAFPHTRHIAVTNTALAHLTDDQLVTICAHELAHLSESRSVSLARLAAPLRWFPLVAIRPIFGSYGWPGVALAVLATLIGSRLYQRLARAMEVRADAIAHSYEGDPGTYAKALERLYEINLSPVVMAQKRLTHPHLYDRMLASHLIPDYPRPKPPSRWPGRILLAGLLIGALLLALAWLALLKSTGTAPG